MTLYLRSIIGLLVLFTSVFANPIVAPHVAKAQVAFSIRAIKDLYYHSNGESVAISPVGLYRTLTGLYLSARGKTAVELDNLLNIGMIPPNQFYSESTLFYESLSRLSLPELKMEYGIWVHPSLHPRPEWINQAKNYTNLKVVLGLYRTDTPIAGMVASTLNFYPAADFFQEESHHRGFLLPFRRKTAIFLYLKGNGFSLVAVPLAGERLMAYFFLPDKSLDAFYAKLTPKSWERWMLLLKPKTIRLSLPEFSLSSSGLFRHSEGDSLEGIGPDAHEYSLYYAAQLNWASGAKQRTDPEPTLPNSCIMRFDRPFFFVVQDLPTGAWILAGDYHGEH